MTPDKLARLAVLQERERNHTLSPALQEGAELDALRTELSIEQQEKADDLKTWLTDESRRPQLNGIDYLDEQKKRDCDEFLAYVERLSVRVGKEAALVIVEGFLAAAKRGTLLF